MRIVCTQGFEHSLKAILSEIASNDISQAKKFKTYLDTIIINIPTKAKKYKQSIYSDNNAVKDVEYDDYTIMFYYDESQDTYLILEIVKKG